MQKAYDEIKDILATRTINDDDLQKLKKKYGEEILRGALIECLPEDIGLKLFMDKTMLDNLYEGGAIRVAYETLKRNQSDPANLDSVYEDVLNDLDEENKKRYAESEPVVLTGGVISGCEQDSKERKPSFKKLVVAGAVLTLTAICSIALVACNNKEKDQGGINTDPPIVSAQTTAGEIFDNVVDKNALMNFASNCATDKVKEAFAGAESVDFVSSTQDGKSFALVTKGGETTLYAIVSDLTEVDRAILNENAESQVWETVEMNRDTAVKESEEKAVTQKITDAVAQYKAMVSEIIENATLTKTEYTQIDDSLVANDQVAKALGNFEAVFFGPMTESMKYTGGEQLSTENCTMSYAFGLNKDGTLSTFVVTYPDNGETSQEKLDAIASGSALISNAGTIIPGKTFKFPPLKQEEQIVSFEELYNQVFRDYNFVSFEKGLQALSEKVFSPTSNVKLMVADVSDNFVLYADGIRTNGAHCLLTGNYIGSQLSIIKEYKSLSEQVGHFDSFEDYVKYQIGGMTEISESEESEVLQQMSGLLNKLQNLQIAFNNLQRTDFDTERTITNTTTPIDFSKFEEEFMPKGIEPIACYVEDLKGRYMESSSNPYFNTGYYNQFDLTIAYVDQNGDVVCEDYDVIIPQYTNSTNESLYDSALGEENITYKTINEKTTTIQDPILTGNTSLAQDKSVTTSQNGQQLSK